MRNKKLVTGIIAVCTAASLLAGCKNNAESVNKRDTTIEDTKDNDRESDGVPHGTTSQDSQGGDEGESGNSSVQIENIKAKYANETTEEYADALYNLERDHVFTYDITEKFFDFEKDEYDCFAVYYDAALSNRADVEIIADYDTMKLTISPNLMFDYNEEGSCLSDGTWGTRSKFYLVQYVDIETGEDLAKPLITVFTVKDELNTPTLTQKMGEDGYYELSWSAIEGADYYEVYEYQRGMDAAFLEYTTMETTASYKNFATNIWHEERFEETYGGTEIDVTHQWVMNALLDVEAAYFVVAKTDDGKCSGMSNECKVSDVGNQIPVIISDDFVKEYSGDTILALPAYVDVRMLDGSVGKFLIEYDGATATLLTDGTIVVEPKIKNLPIEMHMIEFTGMDFDSFMSEAELIKNRTQELSSKSVTSSEEINIPYVPEREDIVTKEPEKEPETTEPETTEPETTEPETTEPETTEPDISSQLMDTVYANTALSEWIAINLLTHNEEISLADFPESANTEYLTDAFFEAYHQNPLCGIIYTLNYDYSKDALVVTYVLDKEETEKMQTESLKKAQEIVEDIIDNGMSDFEKENAINTYLCENAQYNDEIMEYINSDGTISGEAVERFAHSFTPYGVLVENLGVCESYSEAFKLLCEAADMEVIIETGRLSGVNHEWNRVKVNGDWCIMDVTNNDSEYLPNCYFNLSDDMASTILIADKDALADNFIGNYAANFMDYEYYTQNELYTEDDEKAVSLLVEQLSDNDIAIIRIESGLDESTVLEIVQNAVNEADVSNGMYYYNNGVLSIVKK